MRSMKLMKHALSVAAALFVFAGNSQAQNLVFNAVGSSAMFLQFGQAANGQGAVNICTASSGAISAHDSRNAAIPDETGSVFVMWDNAVPQNVYLYLQTDSTVGNRLFFATPRATVVVPNPTNCKGPGTGGLLASVGLPDTVTALPAGIQSFLNGKAFNAGMTDIRPEDAKFATTRAFANCGSTVVPGQQYLGLGYQSTVANIGVAIQSDFTATHFNVIDFSLSGGRDPFSGATVPPTLTSSIGAAPIVVAVNTSVSTGFGQAALNNVDSFVLSAYYDGTVSDSNSIFPQAFGVVGNAVTVLTREPLSGTYNTFEYNVPNGLGPKTSQDANNCSGVNVLHNPLHNAGKTLNSLRRRVIGTGEMLTQLGNNANNDSIGYFFWSFANASKLIGKMAKYIQLDGTDPIADNYSVTSGAFPALNAMGHCAAPCPVTFSHIKDGSYRAWSVLRLVTANPEPAGIAALITGAQNATAMRPDFVDFRTLEVFRSHFLQSGVSANNGNGTPCSGNEAGGDVGGGVLTKAADGAFCKQNAILTGIVGKRQ